MRQKNNVEMKRFTPPQQWCSKVMLSNVFVDLRAIFNIEQQTDWPSCQWLNQFITVKNENKQTVCFVEDEKFTEEQRYYEQIIYETGQVPTRQQNWHDLFGALIWCLFPKTKALLNHRHIQDIELHGLKQRSKHRNALTLFDECGVIMAVSESHWQPLLTEHQWYRAFVEQRSGWGKTIRPFMFGHANYEMMTKPYIGLTGKALFVKVPDDIFCKDLKTQYTFLDTILYEMIKTDNVLKDNSQLSPLPLLGVPGWWDENKDPNFYSNTDYFRPKRRMLK